MTWGNSDSFDGQGVILICEDCMYIKKVDIAESILATIR